MSRLTILLALVLGILPARGQPTTDIRLPATGQSRPNVLFLAVDDMNDWVGCLGGYPGKVHTPHLDRLAAIGTAFTNAHCAAPVCCPSRAAAMSGLLPTTTGIYNNQQWWKPNLPGLRTIPVHFRENGYYTIGSGKIFHHTAGNNPPGQWHHFQRMLFNDNAWIRHGSPNYPWTKPKPRPDQFPYSGIKLYSGEADWGALPLPEADYDDFVTADYAAGFLSIIPGRDSPQPDDPFFLACGLFHPHMPWYVPQRFLDLYPPDEIVIPEPRPEDLDDIPPPGKKLALRKADDLARIRKAGKWRSAVRHYLASISFADAQIGRVLDALQTGAYAGNTIIVLWSDHGWLAPRRKGPLAQAHPLGRSHPGAPHRRPPALPPQGPARGSGPALPPTRQPRRHLSHPHRSLRPSRDRQSRRPQPRPLAPGSRQEA